MITILNGVLLTVETFVLSVVGDSNQFDIVSETHFSCSTIGRELWLAILRSLLCPEPDWNICIGKQGYVFNLTDLKSGFVMFYC